MINFSRRNLFNARITYSGFINKIKNVTDSEREDLLIKIIQLHKFCQQGLKPVSDFLSIYLKTWNGRSFKRHIYELIQWFVCSNLRGNI